MKIKKGDKVKIIVGKDKGKEGKIEKVYQKQNKVLIPGLNIYKKHVKKSEEFPKGGIVDFPRPINRSNVMFICPKCKKPTRLGLEIQGNKKNRVCKKCNSKV